MNQRSGGLATSKFLTERAADGDAKAAIAFLRKAPDVEPDEGDAR